MMKNLLNFLKKNKLLNEDSQEEFYLKSSDNENKDSSPFRLIIEGKIPSYINR